MAIGKEAIIIFEKYKKQQIQIFNDACDYGVLATDKVKEEMKYAVQELASLDDYAKVEKVEYMTGFTWKFKAQWLIESSVNYPGKYNGYVIQVEYVHSNKPLRPHKEYGYFIIDIQYNQELKGNAA